ncbi:helix-turn-helix domain-containing protein [Aeoliella sp. ICT_H6.2]|uniref:Helix-turn-helix domain-containing protein n=1 Tax=Aeoliella straminimaris TaxID=2954799 RepID=A0A9X2JF54_9BACT|nr:helix-turn-helix domain-containing protein [Aeoliella straminimaris]MCO6043346.1 helix-turn-helix domain-containing protein [Aeoliella straminimaris]
MRREKPPSSDSAPDFYTVYELAHLLKVTPATVRNWTRAGRLVSIRLSPASIRYGRHDVVAFLAASCNREAE